MVTSRKLLILAAISSLAACDHVAEPRVVSLELQGLQLRQYPFGYNGDWGLILEGNVADRDAVLANDMRVAVRAVGERGDVEDFLLIPHVCVTEDDRFYECAAVLVWMSKGRHIREIADAVDKFPARIRSMYRDGQGGGLWLFGRSVKDALRYGWLWPGVTKVERSWLGYFDNRTGPVRTGLTLPVVVEFAAPMPGDGRLQLQAHEQVRLQYTQPDGSLLEVATAMCEHPPGPGGMGFPGPNPPCG
jgi:hypothetical protein